MKLRGEDLLPLAGIRGWLGFMTVWSHYLFKYTKPDQAMATRLLLGDFQITTTFFLLSGLSTTLGEVDFATWKGIWSFWRKRMIRMFPAYFFSMLIRLPLYAVYVYQGDPSSFWQNLLVISSLSQTLVLNPERYGFLNISLWQPSVIFWCLIMLPFALPRLRKLSTRTLVLGYVVLWIIPIAIDELTRSLLRDYVSPYFSYFTVYARWPHFFAGVIIGLLCERLLEEQHLQKPPLDKSKVFICDWIADAGIVATVKLKTPSFYVSYTWFPLHSIWLAAVLFSSDRSWTRRACNSRPLLFFESVSYAACCTHAPIIEWIIYWMYGLIPMVPAPYADFLSFFILDWYHCLWVVPLCMSIAYLVSRWIEQPINRMLRLSIVR